MGEAIVQTVAGSPPITIVCHTVRWLLGARWIRQTDIYRGRKKKSETDDLLVGFLVMKERYRDIVIS